jgi:hypothetical protein
MAYQVTGNTVITDLNTGVFANVNILSSGSLIVTSNNNLTYLQGTVGYSVHKSPTSPGTVGVSSIARMPFASETVTNDIGYLLLVDDWYAGQGTVGTNGPTHGYLSGTFSGSPNWAPLTYSRIERFPFASSSAGSGSIGNLIFKQYNHGATQSATHGYNHGADCPPPAGGNGTNTNNRTIQKYPFSATSNATSVGTLSESARGIGPGGTSSSSHGYTYGGWNGNTTPYRPTLICKFPFASDSNATEVGGMAGEGVAFQCHIQSEIHGYITGGGSINIEKFPFSYDAPSVIVGRMINPGRNYGGGMSSRTNGYKVSGYNDLTGTATQKLDRFPFANDVPSVDLGTFSNLVPGVGSITFHGAT